MQTITIPQPKTAQEAAQQARVLDRALRLAVDGYKWEPICGDYLFGMFKPGSDGLFVDHYVDMLEGTCDCPFFQQHKYCKHVLAVDAEQQQIAQLEARYAEH